MIIECYLHELCSHQWCFEYLNLFSVDFGDNSLTSPTSAWSSLLHISHRNDTSDASDWLNVGADRHFAQNSNENRRKRRKNRRHAISHELTLNSMEVFAYKFNGKFATQCTSNWDWRNACVKSNETATVISPPVRHLPCSPCTPFNYYFIFREIPGGISTLMAGIIADRLHHRKARCTFIVRLHPCDCAMNCTHAVQPTRQLADIVVVGAVNNKCSSVNKCQLFPVDFHTGNRYGCTPCLSELHVEHNFRGKCHCSRNAIRRVKNLVWWRISRIMLVHEWTRMMRSSSFVSATHISFCFSNYECLRSDDALFEELQTSIFGIFDQSILFFCLFPIYFRSLVEQ